LAELVR